MSVIIRDVQSDITSCHNRSHFLLYAPEALGLFYLLHMEGKRLHHFENYFVLGDRQKSYLDAQVEGDAKNE